MKKLKMLFSMICAIAIVSSLCVPAFAYSDGDREVLYYNFHIGTDELVGCSSSSMKRLYNRQWVVTVSSRANNRYAITYGILDNNATEWDYALVSKPSFFDAGAGDTKYLYHRTFQKHTLLVANTCGCSVCD
jgi:hypothetical protein